MKRKPKLDPLDFPISLDGEPCGTAREMVDLPENAGVFEESTLAALADLRPGDTLSFNQGAGGVFVIVRLREKRLYQDDTRPSG